MRPCWLTVLLCILGCASVQPRGRQPALANKAHKTTATLPSTAPRQHGTWHWPASGPLTSPFGWRQGRPHDGIDIGARRGSWVRAAAAGKVVFAQRQRGYGNMVILQHTPQLMTVYAHHDSNWVRLGQKVQAGDRIARVGSSGRSSGPHLHFEVRRGTLPQNPLLYLVEPDR